MNARKLFLFIALFYCSFVCAQTTNNKDPKTIDDVPKTGYYTSPIYSIDGALVHDAPTIIRRGDRIGRGRPKSNILEHRLGSFINKNGAARVFAYMAILGEASMWHLQKRYEDKLMPYFDLLEDKLPRNVGQLLQVTYKYGQSGADPNSVRLRLKGIGNTPEEALAQDEIAQIGEAEYSNVEFNQRHLHFVWIKKDSTGNLKMETIEDPFIENFRQRAFEIKTDSLRAEGYFIMYSDPILGRVRLAEHARSLAENYEYDLRKRAIYDTVTNLNNQLAEAQKEMNELRDQYNKAANQRSQVGTVLSFAKLLFSVNSSFNPSAKPLGTNTYNFENNYLAGVVQNISDQMKAQKIEMKRYIDRLNAIYRNSNIPKRIQMP